MRSSRFALLVNSVRNPETHGAFLDALLQQGLRFEDVSPPDWLGAPMPSWDERAGKEDAPVRLLPSVSDRKHGGGDDPGATSNDTGIVHDGCTMDDAALEFQQAAREKALSLRVPVDPLEWVSPIRALAVWAPIQEHVHVQAEEEQMNRNMKGI